MRRPGRYVDEEVFSPLGYPQHHRPKPISRQIERLRELFPALRSAASVTDNCALPMGAEGWFAVPRWERIASTHGEARHAARKALFASIEPYNPKVITEHLWRIQSRTASLLGALGERQRGCDILVFPAQFGLRHRGRSLRRTREALDDGEFGLSFFEVAAMLLTHPERLARGCLGISCAGDAFEDYLNGDGDYVGASCFHVDNLFGGRPIQDFHCWDNQPLSHFGSPTGFLLE